MTNFGASKSELNLKYRLGLEHALAKADFLGAPDLVLVQAFAIFLFLLRRHDSPRFVWMMTGLAIRMAQSLGLHRDGEHFPHLTPFEVEMRRRAWWALCMLDARAAEDQGTELTITHGSFDTRLPRNINDCDIGPETGRGPPPPERDGLTDMTTPLLHHGIVDVQRRMMAAMSPRDGRPPAGADLDNQSRLLDEVFGHLDRTYLRHLDGATAKNKDLVHWVNVTVARLVVAKMTLLIYLPALLSPAPSSFSGDAQPEHQQQEGRQSPAGSEALRARLFVAALEVAEYNHALNAERACRNWRWIFQTYTHWHAVVHLLLAVTAQQGRGGRRPWSPASERAWVALHSAWLIPAGVRSAASPSSAPSVSASASAPPHEASLGIWVPLRRLMARARRHRSTEIARLREDPGDARRLLEEDRAAPQPASCPGPLPGDADPAEFFRERWKGLVGLSEEPDRSRENAPEAADRLPECRSVGPGEAVTRSLGPSFASAPGPWYGPGAPVSQTQTVLGPVYGQHDIQAGGSGVPASAGLAANPHGLVSAGQQQQQLAGPFYGPAPSDMRAWAEGRRLGVGFTPWLWADSDSLPDVSTHTHAGVEAGDFNGGDGGAMDLDDGNVDWNTWLQSVRGMEVTGDAPAGGWIY